MAARQVWSEPVRKRVPDLTVSGESTYQPGFDGLMSSRNVISQLGNPQLSTIQRQALAGEISQQQGNGHLWQAIHHMNFPGKKLQRQSAQPTIQPSSGLQPPTKSATPSIENTRKLRNWLRAHIAGHPLAATTYTFYERIDQYLGPWGASGYPIAYGKKYNVLFSANQTLVSNPVTRRWLWRTTIKLQKHLMDFILNRYAVGTLHTLSEAELREAAFDSHPLAYTESGLATVAAAAPELIPVIASIPGVEFLPWSENFEASVAQVVETTFRVIPQTLGILIAAAFPAHTGMYRIAARRDRSEFMARLNLNRYLGSLLQAIENGRLNNIHLLEQITDYLYAQEFPDQGYARYANQIISAANSRKIMLAQRYSEAIKRSPGLANVYSRTQPGWKRWLAK